MRQGPHDQARRGRGAGCVPWPLAVAVTLVLWLGWGSAATQESGLQTAAVDSSVARAWRAALGTGATTAAQRAEWLARRRQFTYRGQPYGLTALPLLYYGSFSGWSYGARFGLSQYSRPPFAYRISGGAVHTGNRVDGFLRLRLPSLRGGPWGLALLADLSEGRRRYFGQGNDSRVDHRHTDPDYYTFRITKPRLFLLLDRALSPPLVATVGLGWKHVTIDHADGASLLFEEQPPGLDGGAIGLLGTMLRWDTRDDEGLPRRGALHEWSYETSHGSLGGLLLPSIGYSRYTVADLRYRQVGARLFLAHRTVFEVMQGNVPIDVYSDLGGLRRKVRGLGGDETLRGYLPSRFIDDVRAFTNSELRCRLHVHRAARQHLEWLGVLFVDTGRVWPDLGSLTLRDLHATAGGGLRLYWNEDLVISLEFQRSPEDRVVATRLGNLY